MIKKLCKHFRQVQGKANGKKNKVARLSLYLQGRKPDSGIETNPGIEFNEKTAPHIDSNDCGGPDGLRRRGVRTEQEGEDA